MYVQSKPEGLIRLQAGVQPLLKMAETVEGATVSPLRGCAVISNLAGVAPLSVVLTPLWGLHCK